MTRSPFADVPLAPPDPILGLTEAFNADKKTTKYNLAVGVYQDGHGNVPVLNVVREAERRWYEAEKSKTYLPIDGLPAYRTVVQRLLFGSSAAETLGGRAVTAQALGGTGALKIGADLLKRFLPTATISLSAPSWDNHRAVFEAAGFTVTEYPYYDPATKGLDFAGMKSAIAKQPPGTVVLLHACCHNPTGVDLDAAQWAEVLDIVRERGVVPFLDFAYQGFAKGIDEDAFAVRMFAAAGIPVLISSSFSKSFSLYRERVGAFTILASSADEAVRLGSQLKRVIRTNYSSPSSHGAQIVALVANDPELRAAWEAEVGKARDRIRHMRALFVEQLARKCPGRDFSFINRQNGMFSFSGIEREKVHRLRAEFGLYIVDSGRICVAAMNENNIEYITSSIASVL